MTSQPTCQPLPPPSRWRSGSAMKPVPVRKVRWPTSGRDVARDRRRFAITATTPPIYSAPCAPSAASAPPLSCRPPTATRWPNENVWEFLRSNFLSHCVWDTYEAILKACRNAWNKLMTMPRMHRLPHQALGPNLPSNRKGRKLKHRDTDSILLCVSAPLWLSFFLLPSRNKGSVSGDTYEVILQACRDAWNKLVELPERTASLNPGALEGKPVIL